jgi:YesN/AraC family two-component response regulator
MIRENKNIRNNSIPFIFLSALGQKDDVIKGVNLSANDYLIKPIDFDLMIAKIKEKTSNLIKVQEIHSRNIKNIKSQVSTILPSELFSYLDVITQIATVLKSEPYGPLPHRRYMEDFDRIYINSIKIRSSISNSLDESVIDYKLNAEEEIFSPIDLIQDFTSSLNERFKNKIAFGAEFDISEIPQIKIDRLIFFEALKKIFAGYFKSDQQGMIVINMMMDHTNQLVMVFYLQSEFGKVDLKSNVDESQISRILDRQNCRFEIAETKDNTSVFVIPSYRLIH